MLLLAVCLCDIEPTSRPFVRLSTGASARRHLPGAADGPAHPERRRRRRRRRRSSSSSSSNRESAFAFVSPEGLLVDCPSHTAGAHGPAGPTRKASIKLGRTVRMAGIIDLPPRCHVVAGLPGGKHLECSSRHGRAARGGHPATGAHRAVHLVFRKTKKAVAFDCHRIFL